MKEVVVTIGSKGEVEIEVNGAKGTECEDLTAFIEKQLGRVTERTHKPEYGQSARQAQRGIAKQ